MANATTAPATTAKTVFNKAALTPAAQAKLNAVNWQHNQRAAFIANALSVGTTKSYARRAWRKVYGSMFNGTQVTNNATPHSILAGGKGKTQAQLQKALVAAGVTPTTAAQLATPAQAAAQVPTATPAVNAANAKASK